jgi:hypothetical protein
MKKELTDNDKKRMELIDVAYEYEGEIEYFEYQLIATLSEIKKLSPTKKELKDGLEDLMAHYI